MSLHFTFYPISEISPFCFLLSPLYVPLLSDTHAPAATPTELPLLWCRFCPPCRVHPAAVLQTAQQSLRRLPGPAVQHLVSSPILRLAPLWEGIWIPSLGWSALRPPTQQCVCGGDPSTPRVKAPTGEVMYTGCESLPAYNTRHAQRDLPLSADWLPGMAVSGSQSQLAHFLCPPPG